MSGSSSVSQDQSIRSLALFSPSVAPYSQVQGHMTREYGLPVFITGCFDWWQQVVSAIEVVSVKMGANEG